MRTDKIGLGPHTHDDSHLHTCVFCGATYICRPSESVSPFKWTPRCEDCRLRALEGLPARRSQSVIDVVGRAGVSRVRPNGQGIPEAGIGLAERFAIVLLGLALVLLLYGGLTFWARAAADWIAGAQTSTQPHSHQATGGTP
jgi:hypothetical protein